MVFRRHDRDFDLVAETFPVMIVHVEFCNSTSHWTQFTTVPVSNRPFSHQFLTAATRKALGTEQSVSSFTAAVVGGCAQHVRGHYSFLACPSVWSLDRRVAEMREGRRKRRL